MKQVTREKYDEAVREIHCVYDLTKAQGALLEILSRKLFGPRNKELRRDWMMKCLASVKE